MEPYEAAMFKKINAGKGRCKCMIGRKGRKRKRGWRGVGWEVGVKEPFY
jgi:hypothetical protein